MRTQMDEDRRGRLAEHPSDQLQTFLAMARNGSCAAGPLWPFADVQAALKLAVLQVWLHRSAGNMRLIVVVACASLLLTSCQSVGVHQADSVHGRRSCDTAASRDGVTRTVQAFFDALATDDYPALQRVTTPSFYAFDVGKRYSARELSELIKGSHDAGRVINWSVGPITARVDCAVASAAWENTGSAGTAARVEPRVWLESAVLVRTEDRWLIDFLHSTPKDPRP